MVKRNFCGIFRTKIEEGIYSFDIMAVLASDLSSSLVGYCVVNTKKECFSITLSSAVDIPKEESKKIAINILDGAKKMEKTVAR